MTGGSGFGDHLDGDVGVPSERGESWGEAAERLRPDATIDLSCPNGCYSLKVEGHHGAVDAAEFLKEEAIKDDPGPCSACGSAIVPEVTSGE